jgi:hypothetical protein
MPRLECLVKLVPTERNHQSSNERHVSSFSCKEPVMPATQLGTDLVASPKPAELCDRSSVRQAMNKLQS